MASSGTDEEVVVVMGATGAGKSSLIKLVTEDDSVVVGHSLTSETQAITAYPFVFAGRHMTLVDTPGFNDTYTSDGDILQNLVEWLTKTYKSGQKISAIVYLHNITDVRLQGSSVRNLRVFEQLCGPDFARHVVLCASFWSAATEQQEIQRQRMTELTSTNGMWNAMISNGAKVFQEELTRRSAIRMIFEMIGSPRHAMQVQREIVDEHKSIQDSSAVSKLMALELERAEEDHKMKMAEMREQLQEQMRIKDRTHSENLEGMRKAFEEKLAVADAINAQIKAEIEIAVKQRTKAPVITRKAVQPQVQRVPTPFESEKPKLSPQLQSPRLSPQLQSTVLPTQRKASISPPQIQEPVLPTQPQNPVQPLQRHDSVLPPQIQEPVLSPKPRDPVQPLQQPDSVSPPQPKPPIFSAPPWRSPSPSPQLQSPRLSPQLQNPVLPTQRRDAVPPPPPPRPVTPISPPQWQRPVLSQQLQNPTLPTQLKRAATVAVDPVSIDQEMVMRRKLRHNNFAQYMSATIQLLESERLAGRVKCSWSEQKSCYVMVCTHCLKNIGSGFWYMCVPCADTCDFILCQSCHDDKAVHCNDGRHIKSLMTKGMANLTANQCPRVRSPPQDGVLLCRKCGSNVGRCYLHCCACSENFDMCVACAVQGKTCSGMKAFGRHKLEICARHVPL